MQLLEVVHKPHANPFSQGAVGHPHASPSSEGIACNPRQAYSRGVCTAHNNSHASPFDRSLNATPNPFLEGFAYSLLGLMQPLFIEVEFLAKKAFINSISRKIILELDPSIPKGWCLKDNFSVIIVIWSSVTYTMLYIAMSCPYVYLSLM